MMVVAMRRAFLGLFALLALTACQSGTYINEVSSEKPEVALLKRVLVVGVDISPDAQKAMEQAFASRLAGKGREVVLASSWYPEQRPTREQVAERAAAEGVSSVLVTRLLNFEVEDNASQPPAFSFSLALPPRNPGGSGWEQDAWVAGQLPSAKNEPALMRKAQVETRLYDALSGQVMWEARSRTVMAETEAPDFDGFAAAIVAQLRRNGWILH